MHHLGIARSRSERADLPNTPPSPAASAQPRRRVLALLLLLTGVAALVGHTGSGTQAAFVPPASTQFDITGFLQEAALDPTCTTAMPAAAHCGGTLKLNDIPVVVPKETIAILPANALTWQELFAQAPAPYTGVATGMALADSPRPLSTYEFHVIGNRVNNVYIAGLIYISQQDLNSGDGYINFMDYTTGEMRVGGVIGDRTTGARVRINDPLNAAVGAGRYGRANTPDQRFTVDQDNPTIAAATGFPMCFPRTDPAVTDDPLCPQANRPLDGAGVPLSAIQMNNPVALPGVFPDATKQAPFEVGDYITFAGTLVADGPQPTVGPFPGSAATYISAHTISDNTAIYTWPGTSPAYVSTEVALIGTGGLTVIGAGEAAIRTRFEGMTTDPSRNVHLYGIDLDPATGASSDRDWGTIGVDPGPPGGALKGRWRFRPPCTAAVATQKACTPPPAGTFLPPTREVRAVLEGAWLPGQTTTYANGIIAGQYHAPILEYIFPENIPGTPIVENNFNTIDFLAKGGYTSSAGTLAGQLNPWPSNVVPTPSCTAPTAKPGGPYTVASGGTVSISGGASGTGPFTYAWAAPSSGSLSSTTVANPVYTAPAVAVTTTVTLSLTATNSCGTSTVNTTVTVNPAAAPTVNHIAPQTVASGAAVTLTATGTDPSGGALTFTWTQTAGPNVLAPNPKTGASVSFAAPAAAQCPPTTLTLNFSVTATNAAGATSAPELTSVTVNPLPDAVTITSTEYRTTKQRLVITASSSVVCAGVTLTLQPYVTKAGTTFDPSTLGATFTNNGGGGYTLTLVGAPEPADPPATPLTVKSNLNGTSPAHGLDKIRQ